MIEISPVIQIDNFKLNVNHNLIYSLVNHFSNFAYGQRCRQLYRNYK